MNMATIRFLLSLPLFYFIARGQNWAIVAMFALNMIAVEACAWICLKLIQRNRELLNAVKKLEKVTKDSSRVNAVLSDVFDAK